MRSKHLGFWLTVLLTQSGCSLFLGNVKPVEEKSSEYRFLDLSERNPDWIRLESKNLPSDSKTNPGEPLPETSVSDLAFQSQKSGSIISLNSACRSYAKNAPIHTLQELTQELLLGVSDITFREEKKLVIDQIPALQTTVRGQLQRERMMLRTVVLQKQNCVFDLMYIARPERFSENESDFSHFVSSLDLR